MSFLVSIVQVPVDQKPRLLETEMSTDSLQLKLVQEIENVVKVNGQRITLAQKLTLRRVGWGRAIVDITWEAHDLLITGRMEGRMQTMAIDQDGFVSYRGLLP